ncbi:MAG: dTMP kinase [Candidatus Aenigmarchaeota archaeon]|nr:dTMP kinase [Candidatus Aenigmarchaeota archaeon]
MSILDILKERKMENEEPEEKKEGYVKLTELKKKSDKPVKKKTEKPKKKIIEKPKEIILRSANPRRKGYFIVFEGIDGAGDTTQTKRLYKYFEEKRKNVEIVHYPEYESPVGKLIHEFLHRKIDLSSEVQFLLYSTDMIKDRDKIEGWLKEGKIVIADRYFTSTISYQALDNMSMPNIKRFSGIFGIPKPDVVIYLKAKAETGIKRKVSGKIGLDRFESNEKLLEKISSNYNKMAQKNIFGKWIIVNGEKTKDEVFEEIIKKL